MGKHKGESIEVFKLTDRQQHIQQPALSSPVKVMIMLYRTSDAVEMKSIIARNMQQENHRRPYDHTVQKENRQYGMTYMWIF